MKVLIINPNSDNSMTESIKEIVSKFPYDYIDIDVIGGQTTPKFIDSEETMEETYSEVLSTIQDNKEKYDIFILACHLDPNLDKLRSETKSTIIGIGEASVLFSQVLGKRYSIIGSSNKTVSLKRKMVESYGADHGLDYIGYPESDAEGTLKDRLLEASTDAVEEYSSDSIVLGCAGFVDIDSYIEENLAADIIDGVAVAIMIADDYAKYKKYKEKFNFC